MRLAEATGLLVKDIRLASEVPHVVVQSHSWRPLKTKGSKRYIPLVGKALWSAKRIEKNRKAGLHFQDTTHQFIQTPIPLVQHLTNG